MPFPPPPRTLVRRRNLLASAAGATLLTGCSGTPDAATTPVRLSAADRTRARAARDSEALADRYTAVIAAHPALTARLLPLRAEVLRHARAFGGGSGAPVSPSAAASGSGSPSASASGSGSGSPSASASGSGSGSPSASASGSASVPASSSPVPADPGSALAGLAAAERALADRRATALLEAPGELARLLASVAAAGAVHAYLLTEGGR
ncbi:hypothetical protein [Streptomyces sp. NPDC007264]|uniref:hypothetical protein n=1 Tax=Streptomyces sp. NPDC007264 TaxID=3364777 RepID=UPI0036DCD845